MSCTNRRHFLAALAAGPLMRQLQAQAPDAVKAEPDKHAPFKLGVASYSLRKFDRTTAISMIKQLHTRYVNIKEFHLPVRSTPDEIGAARKEFENAGLIITGRREHLVPEG